MPYIIADSATPPTDADDINPRIAPRFSSGSASISEALKIAFPAAFRNPLIKAKMHIGTNWFDKNVSIINMHDAEKLTDMIQKRVFELNWNIPKRITEMREAAVQIDMRYPYCSTEKPFSIVKGKINVNGPEASKLMISKQGTKSFKWELEKISVIAAFVSRKILPTETGSPC